LHLVQYTMKISSLPGARNQDPAGDCCSAL
jgi:hypothetical protein